MQGQRNSIIEIILLIIVGVLFYFFLVSPKHGEMAKKQEVYDAAQARLGALKTDADALQALADQLDGEKDNIKLLDQALPLTEWKIRTQLLLQKILSYSGVLVGDVSVDSSGPAIASGDLNLLKDPYSVSRSVVPIHIALNLSGSFDQLYDALKKLESYGRLIDISTISLDSANQDGSLNLRLNGTTYYFGTK